MNMPKCKTCGKTVMEIVLYRGSPKGQLNPDWYCKEHLKEPPDKEVENLMEIIKRSP